jgi:D,D-heptose 1,7-bisphosphate phosphatase
VGYLDSLGKLKIFSQTAKAIKRINESGMKAVVITNQSGVARGLFEEAFVEQLHERIRKELQKQGAIIDGFYFCPHHPTEGQAPYLRVCTCRKPETGMLLQAAKDLNIDLSRSYMIGDMAKDMEMAARAGVKGILVRTGYGADVDTSAVRPVYVAEDILDAVNWIVRDFE